ncbi:aminopeptidase P family protein [Telmatocola sphagniphila]|uniref:Aminopeptidase P family protein n=1 Tax=Telmatocola sphagniphila TaxID=1123043 RepID=A0A8E6EX64_9BACT|nr:Xaa-Pro peptidase family protein [Telmatocola sphagniphila]QVL30926.1 aminopeptidase P family protein [Telmatocola sphagniphila]
MSTESRLQKLTAEIIQADLDAYIVSAVHHVTYLSGFTGDSSYLLVTRDRAILLSDDRFAIQIQDECPHLEVQIRGHDRSTPQLLGEVLSKLGVRKIGIEAAYMPVAGLEKFQELVPTATFVPRSGWIESLRAIKDASEILTIRRAISIAEEAFTNFRNHIQPQDSEFDLVNRMEFAIRWAGGTKSAFEIIAGVGERSALPHCPPSSKKLEEADFLLMDWGASYEGYKSDLTRVIKSPYANSARYRMIENRLHDLYKMVSEAQARAAAKLRPGVHVREVDIAARGYLAEQGYSREFNHGLGHGFGLEIHEAPQIRSNSEDVLQANMVVTLEPGVYLQGFAGVRMEDDFLITPDGAERLSSLPRDWAFFEG